jgi:glycosyltransferase involved in cell wall biosynthesis
MPQAAPQSWTFIVFGLNEAQTLPSVVTACLSLCQQWGQPPFEIIIVDDGSTDATPRVAQELAAQHSQVRVITHPRNLGIGGALRSGYAAAQFENVCAVPADGQFDLMELLPYSTFPTKSFLSLYREANPHYNWFRKVLSRTNRRLNRIGAGIKLRDVNWIKAYKTEGLHQLNLEIRTLLVESEICGKLLALGYQATEIPSKYLPRTSGVSHVPRAGLIFSALGESLRMIRSIRRFRRKLRG